MVSQVQLLSKILNTKDYSVVIGNNLSEEYFFNYKNEFNFIKNHYSTYHTVPDTITFLDTFPDFDVIDVTEPTSYLLEKIYEDYNQAYLATVLNRAKPLLENDKTADAVKFVMNSLNSLHTGAALTCTDILQDTSRYDRYLERTADKAKYLLSTGLPELDAILSGGIDRLEENMVIFARPGVGKTQLLLYIAAAAAMQGLKVGIYEGEMTVDKVGYRIDAFIGHIRNSAIRKGDLSIQKDYKNYINSLSTKVSGSIKVMVPDDVPGGAVNVATLRSFIEKENLDILFVDQYDLLEDDEHAKIPHEQVANIAKNIKKLQTEKHIPIISVDQQTREKNDDNSILTNNAAGSDKVARFATTMLALTQEYDEENNQSTLSAYVVKARDGGEGKVLKYNVNFDTGILDYIPTEKDGLMTADDTKNLKNKYEVY